MPGAIEGRPAGFSYVYSVDAPIEEVEAFYHEQMGADGWQLSKRQYSEKGGLFGGPAVVLDFVRGGERANIMLVVSASEGYMMVMVTRVET